MNFRARPHQQLQMQAHKSTNRISKTRILPVKVQKHQFSIPLANRYFAKISHQKSLIASSLDHSHVQLSQSQKSSRVMGRSLSLQVNRKESIKDNIQNNSIASNLPNIKNQHKKQKSTNSIGLNEIINSQLGTLSFNAILEMREKIEGSWEQLGRKNILRANSITSEQFSMQGEEERSQLDIKAAEQKAYEDYERILMMKQPVIYKRKRFNLKHKAEWIIST